MWIIKKSNGSPLRIVTDETDLIAEGMARIPATEEEVAAAQAVINQNAQAEAVRRTRAERYEAEASVYDLADAETKMASLDLQMQEEGAAQKAAVLARRLQIKAECPKPV